MFLQNCWNYQHGDYSEVTTGSGGFLGEAKYCQMKPNIAIKGGTQILPICKGEGSDFPKH